MKKYLTLVALLIYTAGISQTLGKRKKSTATTVSKPTTVTTTINQANPNAQIAAFASQPYILQKLKLPFSKEAKDYWVKKVGHYYVLNGDIIVGNDLPKTMGLVKIDEDYRWSNGTIPIVIDKSIYDSVKAIEVHGAIKEFNSKTELCLVPRTNERDYVKIVFNGSIPGAGLSSIGKQGNEQILTINNNASRGTVMHELMHAAGFYHEQSRFDRDKHIRIIWKNVLPGMENNFQMEGDERALGNYDICSIMHYSLKSFSTNNGNDFTMACVKDGRDVDCDSCHPNYEAFSLTDITSIDQAYNNISRFPCNTPFPDPTPILRFTNVNIPASDAAMQSFRHRAEVATKTGYPGAFPNFHQANQGINVVGGTIFLKPGFTIWEDVPLSWLGNPPINDFAERMRATQRYAAARGFVAGFPNYFHTDYGKGIVCGTFFLGTSAAEWRDVPIGELGNPNLDDIGARMRSANDYAFRNGFVGGFPTFFHANYGSGIVCGIVLIKQGAAEWKDVVIAAGPR